MLILKVVFLQIFWLAIVLYGASINEILLISWSIFIVGANFLIYRPAISIGRFFLSRFYSLHAGTYMTLP
jgi:hypothetical protein